MKVTEPIKYHVKLDVVLAYLVTYAAHKRIIAVGATVHTRLGQDTAVLTFYFAFAVV